MGYARVKDVPCSDPLVHMGVFRTQIGGYMWNNVHVCNLSLQLFEYLLSRKSATGSNALRITAHQDILLHPLNTRPGGLWATGEHGVTNTLRNMAGLGKNICDTIIEVMYRNQRKHELVYSIEISTFLVEVSTSWLRYHHVG